MAVAHDQIGFALMSGCDRTSLVDVDPVSLLFASLRRDGIFLSDRAFDAVGIQWIIRDLILAELSWRETMWLESTYTPLTAPSLPYDSK